MAMLRDTFGHRPAQKSHVRGKIRSWRRELRSRGILSIKIKVCGGEKARAIAPDARSQRCEQDSLAAIGPQPVVEQNQRAERDHAPTEFSCGSPTDFVGCKCDAVVNEQERNLDEEK